MARRVLPEPPGPVRVTAALFARAARAPWPALAPAHEELAGRGRFVFEIVLSGGKAPPSWRWGPALEVLQAVLAKVAQRERRRRARASPARAGPARRDPRRRRAPRSARPRRRSPPVRCGVPVCRPMRTWIGPAASLADRSRRRPRRPERSGTRRRRRPPACPLRRRRAGASLADHPAMLGERLRVRLGAQLVQEPRRALDVGEEEGDGAGREIGPHADVITLPQGSSRRAPLPLPLASLLQRCEPGCGVLETLRSRKHRRMLSIVASASDSGSRPPWISGWRRERSLGRRRGARRRKIAPEDAASVRVRSGAPAGRAWGGDAGGAPPPRAGRC